jgi:hypothetical protein
MTAISIYGRETWSFILAVRTCFSGIGDNFFFAIIAHDSLLNSGTGIRMNVVFEINPKTGNE